MATTGWANGSGNLQIRRSQRYASFAPELPVATLVKTYVLLIPLVIFAVHGSFSFEYGSTNSSLGALGGKMASAASSEDSLRERLQALIALLLCALPILLQHRLVARTSQRMLLTVMLPLYAIASSWWSQDSLLSLRSGVSLLITTLFAFYLASDLSERQQLELLALTGAIVVMASIALAVFWPQYGLDHQWHEGAWQGLFMQKNVCAEGTLFLLTPALALPSRGRSGQLLRATYISSGLFLIAMTQSRTGWLMTALYLVFMWALQLVGRFQRKELLPLAGLVFAAASSMLIVVLDYPGFFLSLFSRSGNISGRTQIWKAIEESILRRPFLGYGFDAFWSLIQGEASRVFASAGWVVTSAHNGFLNVGLELGLVGLVLVLATIVQACFHAGRAYHPGRSRYVDWCIGVIFLTVVYNLDERTLLATQYLPWIVFLIACAGLERAARQSDMTMMPTESAS